MGKTIVQDEIALTAADKDFTATPVSVGNPHLVLFTDGVENFPIEKYGKILEKHTSFPDGVNVEFVAEGETYD